MNMRHSSDGFFPSPYILEATTVPCTEAGIKETKMSRTLVASSPTPARFAYRTTTVRDMARALRSIVADHALALRAAAEAELPRKRQAELRTLYTAAKNKSAR